MTSLFQRRDETIELREGDYVVAGTVPPAMMPRQTGVTVSSVRTLATVAFAFGFLATALLGLAVTLLS